MVSFVYKNHTLMRLLKQRGDALKYHDPIELKRLNKLITRLLAKKMY